MQITILSGKGGTGKTTISTNLAKVMKARYIDCDVEEPNGFIFLKPDIEESSDVFIPVPKVDKDKCISCKKCVNICQFNALAFVNKEVVLFEKLCHGCGACSLICPTDAILEEERSIGKTHKGKSDGLECLMGILDIGEPMAGPIISNLKKSIDEKTTIIDSAPGSSCNVVKALIDSDYAILVTEPTAFGLHDLKIAVELVRNMNIPFGVIINRADDYENIIVDYCMDENIKIIGIIPFSKEIAQLYSQGKLLVENDKYRNIFKEIIKQLEGEITWS